jgi:hypothetical protein
MGGPVPGRTLSIAYEAWTQLLVCCSHSRVCGQRSCLMLEVRAIHESAEEATAHGAHGFRSGGEWYDKDEQKWLFENVRPCARL